MQFIIQKSFFNENVLDFFFPTVLIKMESKCPQNKTILSVEMAVGEWEGQMSCASFWCSILFPRHQMPLSPRQGPRNKLVMTSFWGALNPTQACTSADPSVSPILVISPGFSVPRKLCLTPKWSFLRKSLWKQGQTLTVWPFWGLLSLPHGGTSTGIVTCWLLGPHHVLALLT